MKNYWSIASDQSNCNYQFTFDKDMVDIEILKDLLQLVVLTGWEFGVFKILDRKGGVSYGEEFLMLFKDILNEKGSVDLIKNSYSFFHQAFPSVSEFYENPHVIVTELAYYNSYGEIEIKDVFSMEELYSFLNPKRVHLYHYLETGTMSPLTIELSILSNRNLCLSISSGLSIWQPYLKPEYDILDQNLTDFPINEQGYIDNRELYLLNTPRLLGFVKRIRIFFRDNNGCELSFNNKIEELPVFPRYL